MAEWYQLETAESLEELKTSEKGLKKDIIPSLQSEFGKNRLEAVKKKSKLAVFIAQFKDVMILILIIAAVISFVVGEHTDAYVILVIIFGNAFIGYTQENKAEESVGSRTR